MSEDVIVHEYLYEWLGEWVDGELVMVPVSEDAKNSALFDEEAA